MTDTDDAHDTDDAADVGPLPATDLDDITEQDREDAVLTNTDPAIEND